MRTSLLVLAACVLATFTFLEPALAAPAKVTICHLPPGNPTNVQTITVGEAAVPAHLAHGDMLGACVSGCLDDNQCNDGNLCTSDVCLPSGECSNVAVDCNDSNSCTMDSCDPAIGCLNPPDDGASCDDGNACTANDICAATACVGAAIPNCCSSDIECVDANLCTDDLCIDGACQNIDMDCTVDDICSVGVCNPASGSCEVSPVSCDDGNVCNADFCDSIIGCVSVGAGCGVDLPTPPEPVTELTCDDGIDNDCDGFIDTSDSDCLSCVPTAEICDGLDNDCDGIVDNDVVDVGGPCDGDDSDFCSDGTLVCSGQGELFCDDPGDNQEICGNDIDDNCDGSVDEGCECVSGETRECSVQNVNGECFGTETCDPILGFGMCSAQEPSPEVCDGLDNNCDGDVDNNPTDIPTSEDECETFACTNGQLQIIIAPVNTVCTLPDGTGGICDAVGNCSFD